jgi:adenosylmethionine-8-amino-7-oxononanoate aminotransferase
MSGDRHRRGTSDARDVEAILAADKAHVWHPYTPMDEWRAHHAPLVVTAAQGSFLHLADGTKLFDGNGSWWVSTLGHNHPRLVAALAAQAASLCHVSLAGITHAPAALLARELAEVAPRGLDQVFYGDDGSTAIEAAVKMAAQYHRQTAPKSGAKKTRFLSLDGAFHGETVGATSLGGVEIFRRPFASVVFDVIHVPSPATDAGGCAPPWAEAFDALAELFEQKGDEIAAIVVEPLVQGAAGMRVYAAAYLRALRDLCDRHDVLLIADEVFTGYGRLGTMWACDQAEIAPDLLCTAKGFTAGVLPMSATLATARVQSAFDGGRGRAFLYGHSYCGNPLGAAVAREVLAIYREEAIVDGVAARAARIAQAFERMAADAVSARLVRGVRSLGMMGAADLREVKLRRAPATVPTVETIADSQAASTSSYAADVGWRVYEEARRRGAYLRPLGDVVYVAPALNMPLDELDALLAVVEESVRAVAVEA